MTVTIIDGKAVARYILIDNNNITFTDLDLSTTIKFYSSQGQGRYCCNQEKVSWICSTFGCYPSRWTWRFQYLCQDETQGGFGGKWCRQCAGGSSISNTSLQAGIEFTHETLPESISQAELLRHVKRLNDNPKVHGVLVQMPLPSHIDDAAIVAAIDYRKDVDG